MATKKQKMRTSPDLIGIANKLRAASMHIHMITRGSVEGVKVATPLSVINGVVEEIDSWERASETGSEDPR